MNPLFTRDEDEESEITLSTASLLGLFLGLVLICGVFFGFGYFMGGRSTTSVAAAPGVANGGVANGGDESSAGADQAAKPSAQEAGGDESAATAMGESSSSALGGLSAPVANDTFSPSQAAQSQPVPLPQIEKPAPRPAPALIPQPEQPAAKTIVTRQTPTLAAAQAPAPTQLRDPQPLRAAMVQVAAVVHSEDAQVLVSALRQHGYSAVVRNEPQDKLLHIQVGPFPTRIQANTMRQKLLSDGYDAIIKQ